VRNRPGLNSELSKRTLNFWFIPGMLVCVFVLSGLCLFFIRRQMNSEEERLRELERLSLDQTQRLFRQEVEQRWQDAYQQFPEQNLSFAGLHAWDQGLGSEILGFCVDNSGILLYPAYQISPDPALGGRTRRSPVRGDPQSGQVAGLPSSPSGEYAISASSRVEDQFRQLLVKRKDRGKVEELCSSLLKEDVRTQIEDGLPLRLPVVTLSLEFNEASPDQTGSQGLAVDSLLQAYAQDLIPITPGSLSWLERLREQCSSRNNQPAWLKGEILVARLVRQRQFAEKFLPRINLLLRRNLYNVSRLDLPVEYLTSDPSENAVLVACKFTNHPSLALVGIAIHLEGLCRQLEETVA